MVKKLKLVDVEAAKQPSEEIVEEKPAEEIIEEIQPEVEEKQEEPHIQEAPQPQQAEQPAQESKKKQQFITCETCNKNMLMKTYRYSHQKLCKDKNAPPTAPPPPPPTPPPPPPTPEPKPKRTVKPKEPQKTEPKQETVGVVVFNEFNPPPDPYKAMREQRLIVRQQRVKHLISQAI